MEGRGGKERKAGSELFQYLTQSKEDIYFKKKFFSQNLEFNLTFILGSLSSPFPVPSTSFLLFNGNTGKEEKLVITKY
jgi:hypothetical protein